jgi:hypothetical protein
MTAKYTVGGLTLQSEMPFPELLPAAAHGPADWTFALGSRRARPPRGRWFHRWTAPQGRTWLSFGRDDDTYVLRFARTATFRVMPERRSILCEGASLVPKRTIRHLLLNQVLPLALTPTRCVLHASAALDRGGVIGFAGHTGAGKSTLSAAVNQSGATLMCDDALVIEDRPEAVWVLPMYGAVRLWPDSVRALFDAAAEAFPTAAHYNHKRTVHLTGGVPAPAAARLRVLCVIAPKPQLKRARRVTVQRLSPREALMRLMPVAFHLDVQDRTELQDSFERLATIVERVPVVELSYPWRLSALPQTARDVLAVAEEFA